MLCSTFPESKDILFKSMQCLFSFTFIFIVLIFAFNQHGLTYPYGNLPLNKEELKKLRQIF